MSGPDQTALRRAPPAARTALFAAGLAVCCALVPVALEGIGRAARSPTQPDAGAGPEVLLVQTDAEALKAWRSRALRGRTIVHAGRYLHFVDADGARLLGLTLATPGTGPRLDELLEAQATPADYLWSASQLRIARRIFYVSPPKALSRRLGSLGQDESSLPLRIDAEAFPRTLDRAPPRLKEAVLLDVNASWFDEGDAESLLATLRSAGLHVELATVSLAEDARDVSPTAREAARAFAATLAGKSLERTP